MTDEEMAVQRALDVGSVGIGHKGAPAASDAARSMSGRGGEVMAPMSEDGARNGGSGAAGGPGPDGRGVCSGEPPAPFSSVPPPATGLDMETPGHRAPSAPQTAAKAAAPQSGQATFQPGDPDVALPERGTAVPAKRQAPATRRKPSLVKPMTEPQRAEFEALWRNLRFKLADLSRRYRASERTLQRWREEFGLPDRKALMRLGSGSPRLARPAGNGRGDVAAQIEAAIPQAQKTPGSLIPVDLDPRQDPDVAQAMDEVRKAALKLDRTTNLASIHRLVLRLCAIVIAKNPIRSDGKDSERLARTLATARKIEAKLPREQIDMAEVRREAATTMMRELREVLGPEDQQVLARVLQKGTELIKQRRAQQGGRA